MCDDQWTARVTPRSASPGCFLRNLDLCSTSHIRQDPTNSGISKLQVHVEIHGPYRFATSRLFLVIHKWIVVVFSLAELSRLSFVLASRQAGLSAVGRIYRYLEMAVYKSYDDIR